MKKLGLIHEGKSMKVYATDDPERVVVEYKDDLTDSTGWRIGKVAGKGALNNRITNHLMQVLERNGIATQYIEELTDRETLVRSSEMIPIEIIVRNVAAGRLAHRFEIAPGTPLRNTILEYTYKNDELGDPDVNDAHIIAMGWTDRDTLKAIEKTALRINDILRRYMRMADIELVDIKMEFGHDAKGRLILSDEISPDTCRFWDMRNHEILDKYRMEDTSMHDLPAIYERIAERVLQMDIG